MRNSLQRRLRADGGFTLIELLIVMIIISILMAVAIPVFLGQKQKALGTSAKANASLVQKTMESCSASTITGTFTDEAGAIICNAAKVAEEEPGLTKQITLGTTNRPGGVAIANGAGAEGAEEAYVVTSYPQVPPTQLIGFRLTRTTTGIVKDCIVGPGANAAKAAEARARMCQPTAARAGFEPWTW